MTILGGISLILVSLIIIKGVFQCFNIDTQNEDEPSNNSFFRLHEAFQPAFSKMMGQGLYIVLVIAALDIANIQSLHSANLEVMIEAAFIAIVLWLIVGTFLVYYAQSRMKTWYKYEAYAHNYQEFDKLYQSYDKIYR